MIITIANIKGGTGKSCLAQNIAVAMMLRKKTVYLVDADPQETTADWIAERRENESLKDIRFSKMTGKIRDDLMDLEKNYDVVVVDCGGHDTDSMRWALAASTHAVLPFRPKRRDLKILPRMEEIIELVKPVNPDCSVRTVITQAPTLPSQMARIIEAKEACESFGLSTLKTIIYSRNIFDDADEQGSSVIEIGTDEKASKEINALIDEIIGEA